MRTSRWLRVALPPVLAVLAFLTAAGRVPATAQERSPERRLFVSALDRDGKPVSGLGPDAFVVREDGQRREILRVQRATDPIYITVLVDNSTAARDAIAYIRKALPQFITALTPPNTMAIVGLADRPTVLVRPTTDAAALTKQATAIFSLPTSGATLLDALYEISDGLQSRDASRAAIVAIVTDGPEFTNRYSKDVTAAVRRAGASVHLITIGRFEHDNDNHAIRERSFLLTEVPRASGGALYTMLAPNGIEQQLEKVALDLKSQYEVVYARPDRTIPPKTVEVTSARDGLTVRGVPARTGREN